MSATVALSDPRVAAVPESECHEPLVDLSTVPALQVDPGRAASDGVPVQVRSGVVDRLVTAQSLLPRGLRLLVLVGYPPAGAPSTAALRPTCICVPRVHLSGAAIDVAMYEEDPYRPREAVRDPRLSDVLLAAGLVNAPTHWWHWSYGDQYWALVTNATHARYGAVPTG